MNLINLKETNNHYVLSIQQNLEKRAKKIVPFEWDSINKVWKYPKNNDTFDSLINEFNQDEVILNITPPVATHKSQEDSLSKKNLIIEKLRLKIDSLENEASEREREIDRYISNIVSLNEKVNQLINNDNDIENAIKKVAKPPNQLNKATISGIEVIFTFKAIVDPIIAPKTIPPINTIGLTISTTVTETAINIAKADRKLPFTAVSSFPSIFMPEINKIDSTM